MSGNDKEDGRGSSNTDNDDDDDNLPASIVNVWGYPSIEIITVNIPTADGKIVQKTSWLCKKCDKSWAGKNSRKALAHGTRDVTFCLEQHIIPCKGKSTEAEIKLFTDLYARKQARESANKGATLSISEDISHSQEEVLHRALVQRRATKKQKGSSTSGYARYVLIM